MHVGLAGFLLGNVFAVSLRLESRHGETGTAHDHAPRRPRLVLLRLGEQRVYDPRHHRVRGLLATGHFWG